eukprot:gene5012-3579_t
MILILACSLAEMTGALPFTGGTYGFARGIYGPYLGFIVGILEILTSIACLAAFLHGFGEACVTAARLSGGYVLVFFFLLIGSTAVAQSLDTYRFAMFIRVFTLAATALTLVYLLGATPSLNLDKFSRDHSSDPLHHGWRDILANAPAPAFFFTGIEMLPIIAHDAREPRRAVPMGLVVVSITSIVVAFLTYTVACGQPPGIGVLETARLPLTYGFANLFHITPDTAMIFNIPFQISSFMISQYFLCIIMKSMAESGPFGIYGAYLGIAITVFFIMATCFYSFNVVAFAVYLLFLVAISMYYLHYVHHHETFSGEEERVFFLTYVIRSNQSHQRKLKKAAMSMRQQGLSSSVHSNNSPCNSPIHRKSTASGGGNSPKTSGHCVSSWREHLVGGTFASYARSVGFSSGPSSPAHRSHPSRSPPTKTTAYGASLVTTGAAAPSAHSQSLAASSSIAGALSPVKTHDDAVLLWDPSTDAEFNDARMSSSTHPLFSAPSVVSRILDDVEHGNGTGDVAAADGRDHGVFAPLSSAPSQRAGGVPFFATSFMSRGGFSGGLVSRASSNRSNVSNQSTPSQPLAGGFGMWRLPYFATSSAALGAAPPQHRPSIFAALWKGPTRQTHTAAATDDRLPRREVSLVTVTNTAGVQLPGYDASSLATNMKIHPLEANTEEVTYNRAYSAVARSSNDRLMEAVDDAVRDFHDVTTTDI